MEPPFPKTLSFNDPLDILVDYSNSPHAGIPSQATSSPATSTTATSTTATSTTATPATLILPPISRISEETSILHSDNKQELLSYFKHELDVSKVNKMKKHLKYAGQLRTCRPLHMLKALGRETVVVETCHLHLTWRGAMIFIKPCPDFLLDYETWNTYLRTDPQIYRDALGFLKTYVSLIRRKSDLRIAHELGLIPTGLKWARWSQISRSIACAPFEPCLQPGEGGKTKEIYDRWCYGELRLGRLNFIYRLCSCSDRERGQLQRGFFNQYPDYSTFLARNITWLTLSTVYMALALTAMQVGLGTDRLKNSGGFTGAAVVFTVFSILAPLTGLAVIVAVTLFKVLDNAFFTLYKRRESRSNTKKGLAQSSVANSSQV